MQIEVLRLGHRLPRDERISTHVALVARAFGASSVVYSGQHDSGLEDSVKRISERWGGKMGGGEFPIAYERSQTQFIKKRKRDGFLVVHLTMYGIPIEKALGEIQKQMQKQMQTQDSEKILLIVGSEQVPGEIYPLADHNVSVTNQPHSEVAALAIVLDRLMGGSELGRNDFFGKIEIEPSERGKKVVERN